MGSGASMNSLIGAGALLCALAVGLGAFGAHALGPRIDAEALGWWQTAVQYQMWHGLAALTLGLCGPAWCRLPAWVLVTGAVIFAATLLCMALGAPRWLGAITPLGGSLMIAGWLLLSLRAITKQ